MLFECYGNLAAISKFSLQSFALMLWIYVPRSLFPPIPTSPVAPHLKFIIALFLPTLFKMSCLQFLDLQEICTDVVGPLIKFPFLALQEACETRGLSKVTWHLSCTLFFFYIFTFFYLHVYLPVHSQPQSSILFHAPSLSILGRTAWGYFKTQQLDYRK